MRDLTTTSYASLGLLALKPWSTYELAKQMERSLHNFWPRAESKIYEEPKNLVAHGLARSRKEPTGKRPRTVYSITPKGRRALRRWLDEPGGPPSLEFEGIMKVFFSDQGSKEQLLEQIRSIREWAAAERQRAVPILRGYLEDGGPFPERLHIIRLMVRFLSERTRFVEDWARWAEEEVQGWPGVAGSERPPVDDDVFRRALEEAEADVGGNGHDADHSESRSGVGGHR